MIRATFLDHSGFLVETDSAALLFDWWKGDLPAVKPPLCVFASHAHPDHFDPKIFSLDAQFILGHDIRLSPRNRERWNLPQEAACHSLRGGQVLDLPGVRVEALRSTDEGVAFLVSVDGHTIFHAGDLNWWHWEGEGKSWNGSMDANFKKCAEPLRGRRIDLAMLPLDPRLGEAAFWGPKYFLGLADIRAFAPMHQWGEFGLTRRFLEQYPAFTDRTLPVERTGQVFLL